MKDDEVIIAEWSIEEQVILKQEEMTDSSSSMDLEFTASNPLDQPDETPSARSDYEGSLLEMMKQKEVLTELLEVYKSYTLLWDTSQALYYNKDARNQAFQSLLEIYQRMKPTATLKEVKKKIENMRSTFKKELKKVKESLITGSKEEYVPTLWYYEQMLFLGEKDVLRPGSDTCDEEGKPSTNANTEDAEDVDLEEPSTLQNPTDTLRSSNRESNPSTPASNPAPNTPPNLTSSSATPNPPKRTKKSLRKKQDQRIDAACSLPKETGNQFDTFGTSVAQQLQILKPTQQAIAQKLMSDVLFFGKLDQLTPAASVLPTAPPMYYPVQHPDVSFDTTQNQYNQQPNYPSSSSPSISSEGSVSSRTTLLPLSGSAYRDCRGSTGEEIFEFLVLK